MEFLLVDSSITTRLDWRITVKKSKCYALYAVATYILAVISRIYKRVTEGFSAGRVLESMSPFETALLTSIG